MKTLCLYYSRTNLTRVITRRIAMLMDADVCEYTDGVDRSGIRGYLRSCIDSFKTLPEVRIIGEEPDWDAYDIVIVAMPTWAESPCIIGKAFLQQFRGRLYLVVTHMAGAGYDKAIRKIYQYCVTQPAAYLTVQTKNHDPEREIRDFVRKIQA